MIKKVFLICLMSLLLFGGGFLWLSLPSSEQPTTLKILTYSSFSGLFGPGRKLKLEFEKRCECKVQITTAEDSTRLLQRLQMKLPMDLVLGLDQISLIKAKEMKWKKLPFSKKKLSSLIRPSLHPFLNPFFLPLDWAPIGWVYKATHLKKVKSLSDLLIFPEKISFPEPQTSTLGLQLYYWLYIHSSQDLTVLKNFLKKLKPKIYGPVSSWSTAYGFLQKNHVEMSLAYLTSLVYHQREENNFSYQFAHFKKGHPYQIEFASVPKNCTECSLALSFLKFLLEPAAQKILMTHNYMFPVLKNIQDKDFLNLKQPNLLSYKELPLFLKQKTKLLKLWKEVLN